MRYKVKIEYAYSVLDSFVGGKEELEIVNELNNKGANKLYIDDIMITAKKLFYDKYSSKLIERFDGKGSFLKLDELENTDEELRQFFYKYTFKIFKEKEKSNIKQLLKNNVPLNEAISSINLSLCSEDEIKSEYDKYNRIKSKKKREGYGFLIVGTILLLVFLHSIINERPRILSGLAALIFYYRAITKLK